MKHLMIDMETLDQTPDAAVLSLGAVTFTPDGILEEKSWIFDVRVQTSGRRLFDFDTIVWWLKQGEEAKTLFEKCVKHGQHPGIIFKEFAQWLSADSKYPKTDWNLLVWSCGASFDIPIVENFMKRVGVTCPWKFWNHRCYRTIKQMHGIEEGKKNPGVKHDALDDARFQAKCLIDFLKANPQWEK